MQNAANAKTEWVRNLRLIVPVLVLVAVAAVLYFPNSQKKNGDCTADYRNDKAGRIGPEKKVVGIEKKVEPSTYPDSFINKDKPAQYVLEVQAGWADSLGINLG